MPLEADNVSELQLLPAASIDLTVHPDMAVDDGIFHVPSGVKQSGELQELPEADDLTADRDVIDRSLVRHLGMLGDQVPPGDGRPTRQI